MRKSLKIKHAYLMYRHEKVKKGILVKIDNNEVIFADIFIHWLLKKYRVFDRKRYRVLRRKENYDITKTSSK